MELRIDTTWCRGHEGLATWPFGALFLALTAAAFVTRRAGRGLGQAPN